jgi:single-strand DNA-binding protein
VVVFNDILVRIIKDYVKKGSKIFIEGELQTRKWQDQSGADKYTTEVVLQNYNANLILLDRKSGPDNNSLDNGSSGGYNSSANYNSNNANLDDEVPF